MEYAEIIYSIIGILSGLGVIGWVKERVNKKKMLKVYDLVQTAIEYAEGGYNKKEIADLLKKAQGIYHGQEK